jgi:hypothetical protein
MCEYYRKNCGDAHSGAPLRASPQKFLYEEYTAPIRSFYIFCCPLFENVPTYFSAMQVQFLVDVLPQKKAP